MIILHVIPGLGRSGGAERSLASTAAALVAGVEEYHVAVLTGRNDLVDQLTGAGVVVHDLSDSVGLLGRVRSLRRLIRQVDPTVVHSTLFDADVATGLAVGRSRPLIFSWANTPFVDGSALRLGTARWKVDALRLVEWALGKYTGAGYQAVTPGVAQANSAALRVPPSRVRVAERGRPDPPPCTEPGRVERRREWGVADGEPLLLAVARHEPQKDLATFVRTVASVRNRLGAGQGLVVGRVGSETESLKAMIADLNLEDWVRLVGSSGDVPSFMCAADVMVLTSRNEGAAGVVIEAMAQGLPIVATTVAGLDGVTEHRVNSLTAPVGDVDALSDAVLAVLADPALARRLTMNARRTYLERFTTARSAESLLEVYRAVDAAR